MPIRIPPPKFNPLVPKLKPQRMAVPGQEVTCSDGTQYVVQESGAWKRTTKRGGKKSRRR